MGVRAARRALLGLLLLAAQPLLAEKTSALLPGTPEPTRFAVRGATLVDRTRGDAPMFFRGIGYSPFLRGESPLLGTELPNDGRYREHLRAARALGADYLHVFPTGMPAAFFQALDETDLVYGQDIWVLPRSEDFLSERFQQSALANVVAAIDHNYAIGRPDRLVLFSVGDELDPLAIAETDRQHPNARDFRGKHLAVSGRTPTEVALARVIDAAIDYELTRYGRRHLYCHTSFTHVGPLPRPDLEVPSGSALLPDLGDLVCLNVYTYARGVVSSPAGSTTGTTYQGYLEGLAALVDRPIFVTQIGLSTSPIEPKPWVPGFGGHRVADVPAVFRSVWNDIRSARGHERIVGMAFFELQDEWWKSGETPDDPSNHPDNDPEEWFGLYSQGEGGRLVPKGAIPDTVREIFASPR
jgi:hypothetical protein